MKHLLILAVAISAAAHAEDIVIPDALVKECSESGGCVIVIPTGQIFPVEVVKQQIAQVAQNAFMAGKEEGALACRRKDI